MDKDFDTVSLKILENISRENMEQVIDCLVYSTNQYEPYSLWVIKILFLVVYFLLGIAPHAIIILISSFTFQKIRNEDLFGPIKNTTVVIGIQVHDRVTYLK